MKKYIIPVLVLLGMTTACVKETPKQMEQEDSMYTLQIRGNLPETKTEITEDGTVFHSAWKNGNQIRVDIDNLSSKKTATYNSSQGYFTCSITGLSEGEHSVNAAYPSSAGTSSGKYSCTIPVDQTMPTINAFDEAADFLVAQTSNISVDNTGQVTTVDMDFRRAVAIVKIKPVDGTTGHSLSALKIKKISLATNFDLKTKIKVTPGGSDDSFETNARAFSVSYAGDDLTFNADTDGSNGAYLIFVPGKFTKTKTLTFTIETDDESYVISKTVTLANDITFGANELRPISVTFGDANVTRVPVIVPIAPSQLEADATDGSFTYTIINPDGISAVSAVKKSGDWISDVSASAGTVTFNCTANTGAERTAVITLSYTGADDVDVTVTQKASGGATVNTYWYYFDSENSNNVVNTSSKFSASSSTTDFAGSGNCGADSFICETISCTRGVKLNSDGYVRFTTSSGVTPVVTFYYACKSSGDNSGARIKITPTSPAGDATVYGSFNTFGTYSSQTKTLNASTTYEIKRDNKELALIMVKLVETSNN